MAESGEYLRQHSTEHEIIFIKGIGTHTQRGKQLRQYNPKVWTEWRKSLLSKYLEHSYLRNWDGLDREVCLVCALDELNKLNGNGHA